MKIKEQTATETYISSDGYYVISQPTECLYTGDRVDVRITLSPEQMRKIILDMGVYIDIEGEWWSIQETEGDD